jgi:glucose-6-phosphate isomerase
MNTNRTAPFERNLPVLIGAAVVRLCTATSSMAQSIAGCCRTKQYLKRFPRVHLQQLDDESNGCKQGDASMGTVSPVQTATVPSTSASLAPTASTRSIS